MAEKTKKPQPATGEIASRQKDIWHKPWGGTIHPRDETLATRGGQRGIWIYDDLERDTAVFAAMQKRKTAVIARDWQVDPASEDAIDVRAADMVRAQLNAFNFDDCCYQLLDAILKGYAVSETMWDNAGGETVVTGLIPRDQRRFVFDADAKLRMLTDSNMITGEELPDRKFVVHTVGSKDGNPYGVGIGTRLYWPVWFKREGMQFWLTFADKFGSPTVLGFYPPGTSADQERELQRSLARISQEAAITAPEGMVIEFLEAARSGGANTYETLLRYCDEMIMQAVLGEAGSSRESGGALAAASLIRNEVRLELSRGDSDLLSSTLNKTLVQWIIDFNLPGARPPKVWRRVEESEDLNARAVRDKTIVDMGIARPTLDYINRTYGEGWEPVPQQNNAPAAPADFAAPKSKHCACCPPTFAAAVDAPQAVIDEMVASLPPAALNAQSEQMLKPVVDIIMAAGSYEEALHALDEAMPLVPSSALETALGRAMFVAETYGHLEASDDDRT